MGLVYVFDVRKSHGTLCRVPRFMARMLCMVLSHHDFWTTPEGL